MDHYRLILDDPLALNIQEVLDEDLRAGARLMQPKYREQALRERSLGAYCAIGAAAYFFMQGGREAGLQPMQRSWETGHWWWKDHDSHWWIVRNGNDIIDLTVRPSDPLPLFSYDEG